MKMQARCRRMVVVASLLVAFVGIVGVKTSAEAAKARIAANEASAKLFADRYKPITAERLNKRLAYIAKRSGATTPALTTEAASPGPCGCGEYECMRHPDEYSCWCVGNREWDWFEEGGFWARCMCGDDGDCWWEV